MGWKQLKIAKVEYLDKWKNTNCIQISDCTVLPPTKDMSSISHSHLILLAALRSGFWLIAIGRQLKSEADRTAQLALCNPSSRESTVCLRQKEVGERSVPRKLKWLAIFCDAWRQKTMQGEPTCMLHYLFLMLKLQKVARICNLQPWAVMSILEP